MNESEGKGDEVENDVAIATSDEDVFHDGVRIADTQAAATHNDPAPDGVSPADAPPLFAAAAVNHSVKDKKKTPPISPIVKMAATRSKHEKIKHSKMKFPPPFPELIYGYHQNDVLSGRGATINAHPGNMLFRSMCVYRKSEFDTATNHQKRQIALEIVESVLEWNPPGRFIERVEDKANCTPDEVDAYFREVDVEKVLVGSSLAYFNRMGHASKKNKKLKRELGPWRDMGIERAIQKACGVIRDHKRPDRIALRAMGMLKRKKNINTFMIDPIQQPNDMDYMPSEGTHGKAPTQGTNAEETDTAQDDDISNVYKEILPSPNDVLLGRGAFINDHSGNRQFRTLALNRKAQFDAANPTDRRTISLEIVTLTKALDPPGRFLKRAPYALQEPVLLSDGKYQLPPRGLEGPWEAVSDDKACAKAIQVMRDLKTKAPKSDDFVFEEAEQVAALASINASMKESLDVEEEQSEVFASVNDSMDVHHEMPEMPGAIDSVGNSVDDHHEMPEPLDMTDASHDHLQVDPEGMDGGDRVEI
ncbi:hypothetical protein ACHAXR_006393 [Thalassiosira sp. AJA248-18]